MLSLNLDVVIKVAKMELIASIKARREEHAKNYKEAQEGWRTGMMIIAREIMDKGPRLKQFPLALRRINSPPECHIEDFDNAIKLIEMTRDDIVELSSGDYEQLVLGRWDWRREWGLSNSKYMSSRVGIGTSAAPSGITDDELE